MAICFVLGENLLDSETSIQLRFSSNTLQNTSGFGICISKIKDTSFTYDIKGITLRTSWLNMIYYTSLVLKEISVCKLMHHNNGHSAYVITYNGVPVWPWGGEGVVNSFL